MPTHRHLATEHQQTLVNIFKHHGSPHIEWADLLHLVEAVGSVVDEGDGKYRFVVNDEHHDFDRPRHDKITDVEEIAELRAFLTRARMTP